MFSLHWCISITSTSAAWRVSASVTSPMGLNGLALSLQINKCTHTAPGTYNNFIFYQSLLQHASYLCPSVFKMVTMPWQTTQQNVTLLGLVAASLNWGHTHYNRSYMNSIQVYTAYNLYTVTPQPEGPKTTLTNCICTPCFYITACLNIVINFCSMPATILHIEWQTNPILHFVTAHISDITHAN